MPSLTIPSPFFNQTKKQGSKRPTTIYLVDIIYVEKLGRTRVKKTPTTKCIVFTLKILVLGSNRIFSSGLLEKILKWKNYR